MFPHLPWEGEMLKPLWLIIFGLCGRRSRHGITLVCWIKREKKNVHVSEGVKHLWRWHWMSFFWAGGFSGTLFFYTAASECLRPSPLSPFFKSCTQSFSLVPPAHVSGHFYVWVTDEFHVLPTGVREEAMGWTMILKDDFGVIAWARRTGNYLSLFLLLSLFSIPVQSDIVFPEDHHFSWKAGKMFFFAINVSITIQILSLQVKSLSSPVQNHGSSHS